MGSGRCVSSNSVFYIRCYIRSSFGCHHPAIVVTYISEENYDLDNGYDEKLRHVVHFDLLIVLTWYQSGQYLVPIGCNMVHNTNEDEQYDMEDCLIADQPYQSYTPSSSSS